MANEKIADAPAKQRFVVDRIIYHTPGKRPHVRGDEVDFDPEETEHLVQGGYMHRLGTDAAPTAGGEGQSVSQPQKPPTVAPAPPPAPMNYQSRPDAGRA